MGRGSRQALGVVAAALAVVAAACGSTVPPSQRAAQSARAGGLDSSLGGPAVAGDGTASTDAGGVASSAGGAARSTRGTSITAPRVTIPSKDGPGVTPSTITIGFAYPVNNDVAQAALGNTVATAGDVKGEGEAVIRDINSHGGVRARQLQAVFHPIDATSTETSVVRDEHTCSTFTQDHKVLMGAGLSNSDDFLACMAKAGAVSVTGSLASASDSQFAHWPLYYDVQALSTDTLIRNLVDALVRGKYFTPWDTTQGAPGTLPVKVGIVIPDQPQWDAVLNKVLLPELAAHNIHVASNDIQRWHFPESTQDNGQAVAGIQAAVLRLHSDNVTHVLPIDVNSLGFFAQPAESQRYRPRYGVSSATGAQVYAGSLVPYAQLHGALGFGWSPSLDLPGSAPVDKPPYAGAGRAHCLAVMAAAGLSLPDANATTVALIVCDELYSLRDAINALPSGSPINAGSLMQSIENLGDRFGIAGLPAARFGRGKHFPVDVAWPYAFNESCNCMQYVGARYKLR